MNKETTYVIGHKTPDSDSVCSAIGFARLKGLTPARAGVLNDETKFILSYFGADEPVLIENLAGLSVALVDHNEKGHAAEGIGLAEVLEIVDHHFIVPERTIPAAKVRNQILGSTAAIVYQMYLEDGIEPDRSTAGLLLGAIISDTLFFRSPTTTEEDRKAAEELALLAETNMEDFAAKIFEAGSNLAGKTVREVFYGDYKTFRGQRSSFGCGALTVPDAGNLASLEQELLEFMASETKVRREEPGGPDFLIFMLTSLIDGRTAIICGDAGASEAVHNAFADLQNCTWESEKLLRVNEILSRKLQLVPQVTKAADFAEKCAH